VDAVKFAARSIVNQFWEGAIKRRGVKLGPDERVQVDTTSQPDDAITIDGWWMKGYGMHMPHRHVRRRIEARELHSEERVYDVFYQVTEAMVHELFPMLPRNGKWRLFGRRPR
jgi:hypothetical protein